MAWDSGHTLSRHTASGALRCLFSKPWQLANMRGRPAKCEGNSLYAPERSSLHAQRLLTAQRDSIWSPSCVPSPWKAHNVCPLAGWCWQSCDTMVHGNRSQGHRWKFSRLCLGVQSVAQCLILADIKKKSAYRLNG